MATRQLIGQMLIQRGLIDEWQLRSALAHQRYWGVRIGRSLVQLGYISEEVLVAELARQQCIPYLQIGDRRISSLVVDFVPPETIRARKVLPLWVVKDGRRRTLVVATPEPENLFVLDEIAFVTGMRVKPVLVGDEDIEQAIERHLGAPATSAPTAHRLPPPAPLTDTSGTDRAA